MYKISVENYKLIILITLVVLVLKVCIYSSNTEYVQLLIVKLV